MLVQVLLFFTEILHMGCREMKSHDPDLDKDSHPISMELGTA